jgi:hypothetical protein
MRIMTLALLLGLAIPADAQETRGHETIMVEGTCDAPECSCLAWRCPGLGYEYCTAHPSTLCWWEGWSNTSAGGGGSTGGSGSSWGDTWLEKRMYQPGTRCYVLYRCLDVLERDHKGKCVFSDGTVQSQSQDHWDFRKEFLLECVILGDPLDPIPMPDPETLGVNPQRGIPMPTLRDLLCGNHGCM